MKFLLVNWPYLVLLLLSSCGQEGELVSPSVITQAVKHDTDDPAIWIDPQHPEQSIIFGTDKDTDGAIYAFNLEGEILPDKVISNVKRPNNVDVEYGFDLNGDTIDILAFTEREGQALRVFSVPDMRALDGGGFPVFVGEPEGDFRLPMGIGLYKKSDTNTIYAIIGRKNGPTDGTYLWQYALTADSLGLQARQVRRFGQFSGLNEIEAIAVDDEAGYVYYSDEGAGIRKYHADPEKGKKELAVFGANGFKEDMEGIAILSTGQEQGYIIVSDQQAGAIRIFNRTAPNAFIKSVRYQAKDTDGLEASAVDFGGLFPKGLLVAMSADKTFHYYSLERLGLE